MKHANRIFITWLFFIGILFILLYYLYELNYLSYVWTADKTKLSFLILAIFLYGIFRPSKKIILNKKIIEKDVIIGYELCDINMALGMVGTVIGFIIMLFSFTTIDFSNIENIKGLFKHATTGMSTALYTTLFGLTTSILLRLMYFTLEILELK